MSSFSANETRNQIIQVLTEGFKSKYLNFGAPIVSDMPDNIETSTVPETITDKMSSSK